MSPEAGRSEVANLPAFVVDVVSPAPVFDPQTAGRGHIKRDHEVVAVAPELTPYRNLSFATESQRATDVIEVIDLDHDVIQPIAVHQRQAVIAPVRTSQERKRQVSPGKVEVHVV